MDTYGIIIASVLGFMIIAITAILLVYSIRSRNFKPTQDKELQLEKINKLLKPFGFCYSRELDIFYTLKDCPQRKFGYCRAYDESSPFFNMIMDCEPITFFYGGKQWLIELWKGQYGITTGAEVGIYNTEIKNENQNFADTLYESAKDNEMMPMSVTLYKGEKEIFKRNGRHWWLTGFVLGEFSEKDELSCNVRIKFPSKKMCCAFVDALNEAGYRENEIYVVGTSVSIRFTVPKTSQPITQTGAQEMIVQSVNKNNCKLFNRVCEKYPDTLDRIEYIMTLEPNLFEILIKSLYVTDLYNEGQKAYKQEEAERGEVKCQ